MYWTTLMKIIKIIKHIYENHRLINTMPKPEKCLLEKVSKERAEEIQRDFFEQFKDQDCYQVMVDEHKKFLINKWLPFVSKIKEGDELWHFKSPSIYWERMMGREGFAILRNGKRTDYIHTIIN